MSLTKTNLEEMIQELHEELQQEIAWRKALQEENRRLLILLTEAARQYGKLIDYVQSLRSWAQECLGVLSDEPLTIRPAPNGTNERSE